MSKRSKTKSNLKIPARDAILECLKKAGRPFSRKQLAEAFIIHDPEARRALGRRLKAMRRDGEIIKNRQRNYGLVEKMDLIKGRVIGHPDGYGFVVPDGGGKDLFLSTREMRTVLHDDRVLVQRINIDRQGRHEAILVNVLERTNDQIVGRYFENEGITFVVPDNKRISQDIFIPYGKTAKAKHGQFVVVKIMHQPEKNRQPIGKVIDIIGEGFDVDMAVDIAIRTYDIPYKWPNTIDKEIKKLRKKPDSVDIGERQDLRDIPFVTIDDEDARDFDDAVYCEKQGSGWRLLVAIADVSYYVKQDSILDEEAKLRGTSVYFPKRVIPMLPEILSNDLCSLKPDVDRLSFVCELHLDTKGKVKQYTFFQAIIRSAARLTYTEMAAIVVDKSVAAIKKRQTLVHHLYNLYRLYQLLYARRQKKGLIDFRSTESKFILNKKGYIESICETQRNDAHRLIEEMMLVVNIIAGKFIDEHGIVGLYRIHETPKQDKLDTVRSVLSQFGLTLGSCKEPDAKDYANLLDIIHRRKDAQMLETILLRSMPLAVYSLDNKGHFGLGFPIYTHFTSPIRRYPDLMIHRMIKYILEGKSVADFSCSKQFMLELADHCSMTERRAEEASRDAIQRLKCAYMKDRIGEFFNATINSVISFGLFVILDDIYIEGLIHVSTLPVDYYHFDSITYTLRGEHSDHVFKIGQKLKVVLTRVDLDDRKIDFELADNG